MHGGGMTNYLVEQSVGGIIRSAFAIYGRHFVTLALVYTVPTLPFTVLQQEATANEMPVLVVVATLMSLLAGFFGFAAITVAVSDICLGNRPSVGRSLSKPFGKLIGRMMVTGLLQWLILLVGLILLVIPFFVFAIWFMFAQAIVVLEGRSGRDALKRSKALGSGYYWRNTGVMGLVFVVAVVIVMLLGGVMGLVGALFSTGIDHWWFRTLQAAIQMGFVVPLMFVAVTLTYYDLRVRKEGYDARALSEELAR